jgi:hypothetical protein
MSLIQNTSFYFLLYTLYKIFFVGQTTDVIESFSGATMHQEHVQHSAKKKRMKMNESNRIEGIIASKDLRCRNSLTCTSLLWLRSLWLHYMASRSRHRHKTKWSQARSTAQQRRMPQKVH